jgi:hypothetical protein
MDNNKTQSVICPIITTLPADNDKTQSAITTMAKRSQASTLPPLPRKWIKTKHNQSSAPSPTPCQRTIRFYCASTKLLPPPPN